MAPLIEVPGMTQAQGDAIIRDLNLGGMSPTGQIFHVEGTLDGTFPVIDVGETQAAFDTFMQQRLGALFQKHGVTSQPKIQTFEAHNIVK